MRLKITRPRKKRKAQPGSFRSCLRNWRFYLPSLSKTRLEKLGFGVGPDLTVFGD
jgi:hypothetical protein